MNPDTAELVGAIGCGGGLFGLIIPAAVLRVKKTGAERDYENYMKNTYHVIPVVELPVFGKNYVHWNVISMRF